MWYLHSIKSYGNNGNKTYMIVSDMPKVFLAVNEAQIINMRLRGIQIENIRFTDKGIKILKEYNDIYRYNSGTRTVSGAEYRLLGKKADKYIIVSSTGTVDYIYKQRLENMAKYNRIVNARYVDGKLETKNTTEYERDKVYIDKIHNTYNSYINKSKLLGIHSDFKISILGDYVILSEYTGTSKKIIIPEFINAIGEEAFYNTPIEEVVFPDSLKIIHRLAFRACNISEVEVPDTIEYIDSTAFFNCRAEDNIKYRKVR